MNKKINTFGIFWENVEYGGMSSHLVDLINSDTFKDVKFTIFTNKNNRGLKQILSNVDLKKINIVQYSSMNTMEVNNIILKIIYILIKPILFIITIFQTYKILKKFDFDVFLCLCGGYGNFRTEMAALLSARILNYPVNSISIHHCYGKAFFGSLFLKFIDRFIFKFSNSILFNSNSVKKNIINNTSLLKYNYKSEVIHLGVNIKRNNKNINQLKKIFKINSPENYKICMLSRIEENKGHLDLVRAFHLLDENVKNRFSIYFIGDGNENELDKIKSSISKYNLNRYFIFTGYIDVDSVNIISHFDLFLSLTKTFEGFGLSCAEALMANTPILSTDVGAVTEFLNNANATIIKPGNINLIKDSLLDYINNQNKWKEKAKIGNNDIKNKFTSEIMSKKIYNHFSKIINNDSTSI